MKHVTTLLLVCAASAAQAQLPAPLAHYPFNGDAQDISANGYHGTLVGAAFGDDPFGEPLSAVVFTGTEHVDLAALAGPYRDALLAITVSFWVRFAGAIVDDQTVLSLSGVGESLVTNVHEIEFENGVWAVETETGTAGTNHELPIDSTLQPDTWYLITVSFDGTDLEYYRNGVPMASLTYVPAETQCADLFLGCYAGNTPQASQFLVGSVDDLRVFSTVLDPAQVTELAAVQSAVAERPSAGVLHAWPLPTTGALQLDLGYLPVGGLVLLELRDAAGRVVQSERVPASSSTPFTFAEGLANGSYTITVRDAYGAPRTTSALLAR